MGNEMNPPGRRDAVGPGPGLPVGCGELLTQLKAEVRSARLRATRVVNTALLELY